MIGAALNVASVDVYLTYRCNLRCTHCFVGENLETSLNFDLELLSHLIESCPGWQTREVTFLGGEPTLYSHIFEAVASAQAVGLRVRMVTNGLHGFARFMNVFKGEVRPIIGFSIDGSSPAVHNMVRGAKAFERLLVNIEHSKKLGYSSFAIVSVSRQNVEDLPNILELCDSLDFTHVNVHYVTNRGFATEDMVVAPTKWRALCEEVERQSVHLNIDVRIEETFIPAGTRRLSCAVRSESNLMFLPDGRVFICPLFIDLPDLHSFTWTRLGLESNRSRTTEGSICAKNVAIHCPAMPFVNPAISGTAQRADLQIPCVLDKTRLRRGRRVDEMGNLAH